ncbi:MAG: hypothetical protein JNL61_07670 [Rhizobiaceae bacterium]|nr:hypothetical protein [Rhizobiaceae bacterium]
MTFINEGEVERIRFDQDPAPRVRVELGRYEPRADIAPELRFTPLGSPRNAVRVTLMEQGARYFSIGMIPAPTLTAVGVASAQPEAAFSIGSRLLRLDGGLLNAVLGRLIGGNVSLDVMDYQALIDADVSAFSFLDALATQLRLTAATYEEVLQSQASVGQIASAMAAVPGLSRRAELALKALAGSAAPSLKLPLKHLIDLGRAGQLALGQRAAGMDAEVGVMDLVSAATMVANGSHQVSIDLGATLPGIASTKLDLAIGEPPQHSPWFRVGEQGDLVRTAQTRVLLTAQIGGAGLLLGTTITLPVYAEAATAEGQLVDVSCTDGNPANAKVTVAATPGIADLRIAKAPASLSDFRVAPTLEAATLVKTPVLTVTGQARVSMKNLFPARLVFSGTEIKNGTVKTVSTQDYLTSAVGSLLGDLRLDVNIVGLGIGLGTPSAIAAALKATLTPLTPTLDNALYSTLSALGVKLGQADVRVTGVKCGRSVLVQ